MDEQQITANAIAVAKKIKKIIAKKMVDRLPQEGAAVSIVGLR